MDEPSVQLHRDLRRAIQDALATRRPLIHHLDDHGSWLLQIPRPESAVKHGARFYWNVLTRSGSGELQQERWTSWVSGQKGKPKEAFTTVAEAEELIRENEVLASGLRPSCARKSTAGTEDDAGAVESLIDAVVVTHEDHVDENGMRKLHPNVPIFAPEHLVTLINGWTHFREVSPLPTRGSDGGRDWRSTSVPPLPDWIGIGMLPQTDGTTVERMTLAIAFNNRYHNHSSKLASADQTLGVKRKRHATIQLNEDEETAEVVVFAPSGVCGSDVPSLVYGDPPTTTLALVQSSTVGGKGSSPVQAERLLCARYKLSVRETRQAESWITSWLRKPMSFAFGEIAADARRMQETEVSWRPDSIVANHSETEVDDLVAGESRLLQ